MANNIVDTAAGLATASACFRNSNGFGPSEQRASVLYKLALILADLGGTDYSTNFTQLFTSSQAIAEFSDEQKFAAVIGILNSGLTSGSAFISTGAGVPTLTRAQMSDAIKCLKNYDDSKIEGAIIFVLAAIWNMQQP